MSDQKTSLNKEIRLGKLKSFGHVLTKREVEHLAKTGKIPGKKARGIKRIIYLKQILNNSIDLIKRTDSRKGCQLYSSVEANVWTHRPGK